MNTVQSLKIGDTIYLRKVYSGYKEYKIVGETSRSLVVRMSGALLWSEDQKIPKTLKGYIQGTQHDQKLYDWAIAHRWEISQDLSVSIDAPAILICARALKHERSLRELPQQSKEITNGTEGTTTSENNG